MIGVMGGASRTGDYGSNGESGCWEKEGRNINFAKVQNFGKVG
nr:hypothetical protein [uncultured Capnocytophaga sp.]